MTVKAATMPDCHTLGDQKAVVGGGWRLHFGAAAGSVLYPNSVWRQY